MRHTLITLLLATIGISAASAGPINPPAGPVASTAKPLTEIEPRIAIGDATTPGDATSRFRITQSGSYYLTGNIAGVSGKHGIAIAASGVTIDLGGFEVLGNGSASAFSGIRIATGSLRNIAILNGSVRNWGANGVDCGSSSASGCRFQGLQCSGNSGSGLSAGYGASISYCTAYSNGIGFITGDSCTISNCSVQTANSFGFNLGSGCIITSCTARNCSDAGFTGSLGSSFQQCASSGNQRGFVLFSGCSISSCTAYENTIDGIQVASFGALVKDCMCSGNGTGGSGAGLAIVASVSDVRVEGCNFTTNPVGLSIAAAGNIVMRNTCSGNGNNWSIAANNIVAPIINRTVPASPVISGDAFVGSLGTTDPNANFTY